MSRMVYADVVEGAEMLISYSLYLPSISRRIIFEKVLQ